MTSPSAAELAAAPTGDPHGRGGAYRADRRPFFGYFLTVTQTPQKLTEFLVRLGFGRYGVLALIMLMYLAWAA